MEQFQIPEWLLKDIHNNEIVVVYRTKDDGHPVSTFRTSALDRPTMTKLLKEAAINSAAWDYAPNG